MKRTLIGLLLFLTMLLGCQRAMAADVTPTKLSELLTEALREEGPFTAADPDFIETNFSKLSAEGAIYFGSDEDVCEFGIFCLTDSRKEAEAIATLRAYIDAETEAISSLASLYPSEELAERLACYQDAYVGKSGGYVYYLIMERDEQQVAREVLKKALSA